MAPQVSEPRMVPRWVRAVDLVFVVVAGIVAMSGGFRLHIGGLRIGVTSRYPRPLGAMIGLVRHFSHRPHPSIATCRREYRLWRQPGVSTAATVIAGLTRDSLVGYLAVFVFGYGRQRATAALRQQLANLPVQDAG